MRLLHHVLLLSIVASASAATDLLLMSIDNVVAAYKSGEFTAVQLTTAYIARINEVNKVFASVLEINPDALTIAAALDAETKAGTSRGPMHGIPILIKDNIGTMDKMNNTGGSFALLGATLPEDSTLAAKLRASGAIILGKAALSQWANWRSTNSSTGWTSRGGQCYGAYTADQDPGGSSSGSGVSVALGLSMVALGTETDGSIGKPSQRNSLVGMKPTVGLTSRYLVIPLSERQDSVGPMAKTVKDAAYLLTAIAGYDKNDKYTAEIPWTVTPDYVGACKLGGLKGVKVGVMRELFDYSGPADGSLFNSAGTIATPAVMAATENAITVMKSLGAIVTDAVIPQYATQYSKFAAFYEGFVLRLDFKVNFAQYLAKLVKNPNNIKSQLDLIKYTKNEPKEMWPDRNVALWTQSEAYNFALTDKRGLDILKNQTEMYTTFGLEATLALGQYDVLICPTDHSSKFAAIGGHPFITVPMGYYNSTTKAVRPVRNLITSGPNVPFGLAFISSKWSEEKLFAYAYAYEQATMVRNTVKPYILPTTQVAGNAESGANRLGFSVPLIFALGAALFSLF